MSDAVACAWVAAVVDGAGLIDVAELGSAAVAPRFAGGVVVLRGGVVRALVVFVVVVCGADGCTAAFVGWWWLAFGEVLVVEVVVGGGLIGGESVVWVWGVVVAVGEEGGLRCV